MKRTLFAGSATLFGLVLGLALGIPSSSEACLHVVTMSKDDAVAEVARADRLLARGRPRTAYRAARRGRRRLEQQMRRDGRDPATVAVVERARTITAVAVVRLDGHTPISHRTARRHVVRGRAQRSLSWALTHLRARAEAQPSDVVARVHYAEALARFDAHRDEALAILTGLAERDLMPEPYGYTALLRLLDHGSDGWRRALARCRNMAVDDAERICPTGAAPDA